jgi:hypothetical protein
MARSIGSLRELPWPAYARSGDVTRLSATSSLWRHLSCISIVQHGTTTDQHLAVKSGTASLAFPPPSHFCLHCPVVLKLLGSRIILEILLTRSRTFL